MRVVCGIRLAFQAERCRFEPCSPLQTRKIKMNWFNFISKEDERLVKTFSRPISAYIDYSTQHGKVWIHLFESKSGHRRIESKSDLNMRNIKSVVERSDIYNERIYRWLKGATDSEISSYANAPQDDTVSVLRGK